MNNESPRPAIRRRQRKIDVPDMPIAPMIDCVFLMLVYFMTTSSLERSEADLACPLSGPGDVRDVLPAIDEQQIQLAADGSATWNGFLYAISSSPPDRLQLMQRLRAFAETTGAAGAQPRLLIDPDPQTPHQAWVYLLDAVTRSGIVAIEF